MTRRLFVLPALLFVAWVVRDFFFAPTCDLRHFDAAAVGQLEAEMWRAYYARERIALFWRQVRLLREQYDIPPLRAAYDAYRVSHAALTFAAGRSREEYERALPDLEKYYADLIGLGALGTDAKATAAAELEWWMLHRARSERLAGGVAHATAVFYGVADERVARYGELRTAAMKIRDDARERGVSEAEWANIAVVLASAYRELLTGVSKN